MEAVLNSSRREEEVLRMEVGKSFISPESSIKNYVMVIREELKSHRKLLRKVDRRIGLKSQAVW